MKTNYMGLWKQERAGWYCSKAFTKKQLQELPAKCRLVLRYNKYHKPQENNTPKFIFTFADAESSQNLCDIQQLEDTAENDVIEELKEKLKEINRLSDGYGWYGSCGNCCTTQRDIDDIHEISSKLLELLGE